MRILLVDDHPLIRDGLRAVLQRMAAGVIIAEAGTAAAALEQAASFNPELVLLDMQLPGMNGLELIQHLRPAHPNARLLVVAGETDPWTVQQAIHLGASGFVAKTNTPAHLAAAVGALLRGERYLCPDAELAMRQAKQENPLTPEPPGLAALSEREQEVLKRIARGQTTIAIAQDLGLSPKTVETHRRNILRRLHLQSVQDVTRYAIRHGLMVA